MARLIRPLFTLAEEASFRIDTTWQLDSEDLPQLHHRRTKEQDWQQGPEVHINSLSAIV